MTEHKGIIPALIAAQGDMARVVKNTTNTHFRSKYADLGAVLDAVTPALREHGVAVSQFLSLDTEPAQLITRLEHVSGEQRETPIPLLVAKGDMQGLGSAITYARRYGLMMLAGIAPEDDDGNAAAKSVNTQSVSVSLGNRSWSQQITDELPDDATPEEKATAVADALIAQFQRKETAGELSNEWDRREQDGTIPALEKRYESLFQDVSEKFHARMAELTAPALQDEIPY